MEKEPVHLRRYMNYRGTWEAYLPKSAIVVIIPVIHLPSVSMLQSIFAKNLSMV